VQRHGAKRWRTVSLRCCGMACIAFQHADNICSTIFVLEKIANVFEARCTTLLEHVLDDGGELGSTHGRGSGL
jgi:hypothetical protein